ncbi:MAG: hypothetical protein M0R50_09915 [Candidatus Cloacimonetes bacterium]|jgi:hypothetical protein|nr:hypothetical protein [Candidatus Cloacimonadota bacterium]
MSDIDNIADSIDDFDEYGDDEENSINCIIDGAEDIGISLTQKQVIEILEQVGLDAADISMNQPVYDGESCKHGRYILYKGFRSESDEDRKVSGWVSDDPEFAIKFGNVKKRTINFNGEIINKWSVVHDWDGYPQLIPPGPRLRFCYNGAYLLLDK